MKRLRFPNLTVGLTAAFVCACVVAAAMFWSSATSLKAQNADKSPEKKDSTPAAPATPEAAKTNSVPATNVVAVVVVTPAPAAPATPTNSPAPAAVAAGGDAPEPSAAAKDAAAKPDGEKGAKADPAKPANPDELTVSFQGAQVDMIVQWLAEKTGKSVIKHKNVNCQVTIAGSKKLTLREAQNLIYRALAMEGVTAIESSTTIMLVPEGSEPKMSPELLGGTDNTIPEGRQRLVKIFPLKHIPPAELKEKIKAVVSDKASIEVDDRGGQIIVTDYNDNLRLLVELVKELDVVSVADNTIEIFPIKHADAEELGSLISLILNAQPGTPTSSYHSSRNSGLPPGVMMGGDSPQPSGGGGGGGAAAGAGPVVKIWPDKTSNRIIVSCAKAKVAEVQRLLDILDTDKPEDVAVRTIPLKNVKAQELVREILPLYRAMPKKGPRDTVEVAANDRSNSLIILSSELNFRGVEKLIASLDTEDAMEKVVHTFALKNADAQDVAKQLTDLNQDQDNNNRYPYYYYFDSGSQQKGKKFSVVADRRRNTVIVQAAPGAMDGIIKMVEALDEPVTDDSLAPKIYPLKYVSATDIEDVLNELFLKKSTQRNYFNYFGDPEENTTTDRDAGRLYGKVRITSEPYSNTIILTSNSPENLKAVEDVLKQLDQPSQAGETTVRIGLRFAKANVVANSLNILFAKGGAPPLRPVNQQGQPQNYNQQQQQQNGTQSTPSSSNFDLDQEAKEDGYFPWLGGQPETTRTSDGRNVSRPVSDLVGRVRVVPDQRSNSLLVSANAHFLSAVLKLVEELDAPTASVLIEARILEVSSDFLDKIGVRWSPDGTQVFSASDYDNSFLAHGTATHQAGFGGTTTVNTPGGTDSSGNSIAQALTSLRSGTLSSSLSMDYLVQFLKENTDATVLAEPQINIEDNELGKLFVGQQVPYTLNSVNSPGVGNINTSANYGYKDVGVVLEVTPHINSSGDVALKIHAESSSILPGQVLNGSPYIDTRQFKTDVTARSGDTLVLGGIIQKQVSDTMRKTPILGDIPGLRWMFNKKDKEIHEVELLVFLRPKVVRSPEEAKDLLDEVNKHAPLIKKWEQSDHAKDDKKK